MSSEQTQKTLAIIWNPKDVEIQTKSIEKTLRPLVIQITTLVNSKGPSRRKKGCSKRPQVLVAAIEKATANFIQAGQEIAARYPQMESELMSAVNEVQEAGEIMSISARHFAEEPCSSPCRSKMVRAARNLLSAVTRLLIVADMTDVQLLMKSLQNLEYDLERIKNTSSQAELMESYKCFEKKTNELLYKAAKRQAELKDVCLKEELAAARALLKKNVVMLLTASKVYIRHPELDAARENRDYILRQICEAVNTISQVAQGHAVGITNQGDQQGVLAALDQFDIKVDMNPASYDEVKTRTDLEEQLESIIRSAAMVADYPNTRDEHRERIINECNGVRQALQELLSEYMANTGRAKPSESLHSAVEVITSKTGDLRRQLRKAVGDNVSDFFMQTELPLLALIQSAKDGNMEQMKIRAEMFTAHAEKLIEVAAMACSMSKNEEGVKMVQYACKQIDNLYPQVIQAARVLVARPQSKVAQENMDAFKEVWENQVFILTEAVDDITTIDDFLAVTEDHLIEDMKKCVAAIQDNDQELLDYLAAQVQSRALRVCNVVTAEMDKYDDERYKQHVLQSVHWLKENVVNNFKSQVEVTLKALSSDSPEDLNENGFIEASRVLYDSIQEIRKNILTKRTAEEIDPEEVDLSSSCGSENISHTLMDYETNIPPEFDEYPEISGITTARDAYRHLPQEEKEKIAFQVETFKNEKSKFDMEIAKWDDSSNDIVVLAKQMCMIMMEMIDFTRGRGPLKTTMDVIQAAKMISNYGVKLDKIATEIAQQCPESSTKNDLLAYLQRIALYTHQLNITSKVKADVQSISGNLIVTGLDSATSLIQAAKNLMNNVVLTVKASYVAFNKYPRTGAINVPIVIWKMKAPEKKPLVRREIFEEVDQKLHHRNDKKEVPAVKALSEFHSFKESSEA
ncbi:catenin alpha-like isoform X2 [Tachypleus tridentatus]